MVQKLKLALVIGTLLTCGTVKAEEMTSHGSHVHGEATLTFVLDGNEAEIALVSAAGNIVGFEHKPKNAQEQQQLEQQLQMLRSGSWFQLGAEAGCTVTSHEVRSEQQDDHNHGHADIYANLQLLCQQPERITALDVTLLQQVDGLEKVKLQWLVDGTAGTAELKPAAAKATLR